jgi:hypothetical protein
MEIDFGADLKGSAQPSLACGNCTIDVEVHLPIYLSTYHVDVEKKIIARAPIVVAGLIQANITRRSVEIIQGLSESLRISDGTVASHLAQLKTIIFEQSRQP